MRNISFALTTQQFRNRTKTVTRRLGWRHLKRCQLLCGVVKGMGLRPGEQIERLGIIRVGWVNPEPLNVITKEECELEGFPWMEPPEFIEMFCRSHSGCEPETVITRIEYRYIPGGRY